jgi:type IV pilus assembly protein PilC
MSIFEYTARSATGQVLTGAIEADNHRVAVQKLRTRGVYITRLRNKAETRGEILPLRLWGPPRIGLKDLAVFSRQFATMITAGLPLLRTLTILAEQTPHRTLRHILGQVRADVERGSPLSAALAKHPATFSTLYVNMVKAGEAGGVLAEVLLRLAGFLEKELALRQKVKAATTYPALLGGAAVGSLLFMTVVIIPQFATFFQELSGSAALPASTQIAIGASTMIQSYWWVGIVLAVGLSAAVRRYVRTSAGRTRYDRLKLEVPVLGPLNKKIAVARLARTLGTLIGCGIPIIRALEVAGAAIDNVVLSHAVNDVRASIREGESIAVPMAATRIFSHMVVQMVQVGEETGALDSMLGKVADFYDSEVEATITSLTSILEPALIVGMGIVIGSMLISLYMPIFSLATAAR